VRLRSLLFVPADSERKFQKASDVGADALILDLEDSVAPDQKPVARTHVQRILKSGVPRDWKFFVRINPLQSGLADDDLAAAVFEGLHGIVLPKAESNDDVIDLALRLDALEQQRGIAPGTIRIIVIATETPAAVFNVHTYAPAHPRLLALTWGAEDLSAELGAIATRDAAGNWTFPYQIARAHTLFAASACGVFPLDTVFTDFRDPIALEADCEIARRDGFTGRLAIHPAQVAIINRAFCPSADEIEHARRVVHLFAANPDAGVIGIDGKMYDIPHLKSARKTLVAAGFGLPVTGLPDAGLPDAGVRPGFA
jgi:citrate lyase subunit beta / citryl-CoA lyase